MHNVNNIYIYYVIYVMYVYIHRLTHYTTVQRLPQDNNSGNNNNKKHMDFTLKKTIL